MTVLIAEVQLTGINEIEAKVHSPKVLGPPLAHVLQDMSKLGQNVAKGGAPHHIRISRSVQPISASVRAIGADAATWEIGRRPGAKQPPREVIASWAAGKGLGRDLAFVIARAISRRGLKGRFYMRKASAAIEAALPSRMQQMAVEVEQALT